MNDIDLNALDSLVKVLLDFRENQHRINLELLCDVHNLEKQLSALQKEVEKIKSQVDISPLSTRNPSYCTKSESGRHFIGKVDNIITCIHCGV